MIQLNYLKLTNHLLFKKLIWRLDQNPLTVIRGKNLDHRLVNSNAVGKTLLPSTLTTLLTDTTPMAIKKKSAKELVKGKAHIELGLTDQGCVWKIEQFAKANTVKYSITKDGQAQEVKDIKRAREIIAKIVPLSPDHIFSQFYISSYRPSVLLYGQPNVRLNYFEQIFDLQAYDKLRSLVMQKLQSVNQAFLKNKLFTEQKTVLAANTATDVLDQITAGQNTYKKLLNNYEKLNLQLQKLTQYITLVEQLHDTEGSITELQTLKHKFTKQLAVKQRQLDEQNKYEALKTRITFDNNKRKELNLALAATIRQPGTAKALISLQKNTAKQQTIYQAYKQNQADIHRYHNLDCAGNTDHKPNKLRRKLIQQKLELVQNQKLQAKQPCPLCGQTVAHNHANKLANLKHIISNTKKDYRAARAGAFSVGLEKRLPSHVINLNANKQVKLLAVMHKKRINLERQLKINLEHKQLTAVLKTLVEHKKLKNTKIDPALAADITKLSQAIYRVTNDIELWHKIDKLNNKLTDLATAKANLITKQTRVDSIKPKLNSLNAKLQKLNEQQAYYQTNQAQLANLTAQLAGTTKSIKQKPVLELLSKAYSNKGIRVLQVEALVASYIKSLNRLSSHIYPMPIEFAAKVGVNKFDILATRNNETSDIRSLSGAESRQFLALSALALCSLMPNHLRVSCIILDEIEAGLSMASRKKFVNDFLPKLQEIVPNVIIITPYSQAEFSIPNAKELLLVKHNNVTDWVKK